MLPKKERLTRIAFNRFFSGGRRSHTPLFTMIHAPYHELHVAVVVPKKVAKTAVVRNAIRRRVYESVRQYRKKYGLKGVYIFLAKQSIVEVDFTDLREVVYTQLRTVGL